MKIVIIGNGISGITAARHLRKMSDHDIVIISSETEYFFSRTALMYIYMGHMRMEDTQPYEKSFWNLNNLQIVKDYVEVVNVENKTVFLSKNGVLSYDKLVIAVGSKFNKFGWPGQDLDGVHGLYHLQDLQAIERHTPNIERAVIVGGGLIGIEMAEMFCSRQKKVTLLVREESYWDKVLPDEESKMINNHILNHGVDLRLSTELQQICEGQNGQLEYVLTKDSERIDCQFVGLTVGVRPNVDFLMGSGIEINKGVLVDHFLKTNVPHVYAIGDCAEIRQPQNGRRSIEAVWYTGRMMGEVVAYNILGSKVKYNPGVWFNSAKFFDIEYQVYGQLPTEKTTDFKSLFWKSQDGLKSIRIVYSKDNIVKGFNLLGVRFRHEVCEKWIQEEYPLDEVIKNLHLAHFDPECYQLSYKELTAKYNETSGTSLVTRKPTLNKVLSFLNSNK